MANNSHPIFYFLFHSFISLGAATLYIIVLTNQTEMFVFVNSFQFLTEKVTFLCEASITMTSYYESNLCHIFSEKLFKDMADRMVADGYREAGYTYVSIDVSVQNYPFSQYILSESKRVIRLAGCGIKSL